MMLPSHSPLDSRTAGILAKKIKYPFGLGQILTCCRCVGRLRWGFSTDWLGVPLRDRPGILRAEHLSLGYSIARQIFAMPSELKSILKRAGISRLSFKSLLASCDHCSDSKAWLRFSLLRTSPQLGGCTDISAR